jgi:lysophospholipase L1-like esterase
LRLALSNFYVYKGAEVGTGGPLTLTASIEYPKGTFNRVLFGGQPSTTIPDMSIGLSDYVTLSTCIPPNTPVWTRIYGTTANGVPFVDTKCGLLNSDAFQASTSTLPDRTMGGSITVNANVWFGPLAVIGMTSNPSLVIWGDSIVEGKGIQPYDKMCNVGPPAVGLGKNFPYMKFARSGQSMYEMVAGNNAALRKSMLKYASHAVNELGVNDFPSGGQTTATMLANAQTILGWSSAAFPGAQTFQETVTPRTTSTDKWTTLANQTAGSRFFSVANPFNDAIRAGQPWLTGYFEITDQVMSTRNSGLWSVSSGQITVDGVHPNALGASLMANGWSPSMIHW